MDSTISPGGQGDLLPGTVGLGYAPPPDAWDEMLSSVDGMRPAWEPVADFLTQMTPEEWNRRWEEGRRTMREHGVTYNIYAESRPGESKWRLDPVPLSLSLDEYTELSEALVQRATLLDLVLRDLLGRQALLSEGHLPPALVYGHPGYFRPCVDPAFSDRRCLYFYGADMARGPDGQWRVMMDRTEAPSGFGYALENRQIIARVFPELIRSVGTRPLDGFLHELRETLRTAAPRRSGEGRAVLLTPGRGNEAYFEHAFLARHLGCTLVEAEDLTVRSGRVWLKTLEGLKPVDVILRRTDTAFCDPLELRSDSALGVPGLTNAARLGNVTILNTLGCGVVESPGLMPFLPGLCRHLLGEELKLHSVNTWWCGQTREREEVLARLESMVIKPAFPSDVGEPVFGPMSTPAERKAVAETIRQRPDRFIGQDYITLSTAPTWSQHGLEPRSIMLRMLLCATPDGWKVLPGGMVRVAPAVRDRVVSMQRGGGAKDVWVPGSAEEVEQTVASVRQMPLTPRRAAGNLPSRAADHLYWFGRYHERAEAVARRLRAAISSFDERVLPFATQTETDVLRGLLSSGSFGAQHEAEESAANLLLRAGLVVFDADHAASLLSTLNRLHRNAESVRERLSNDTWLAAKRLEVVLEQAQKVADRPGLLLPRIDDIIYALQALNGMLNETMSRSLDWRFYDLGRRLERAMQMLDLFAATILRSGGDSQLVLNTLLEICDCAITYRGRYVAEPQLLPVLDLLIADDENPRSLVHQLSRLVNHVETLSDLHGPFLGPDQRLAISAHAAVRTADIEQLAARDAQGMRILLERLVEYTQSHLWDINGAITRRYFSHVAQRGRQVAIGTDGLQEAVF